MLVRSCLVVVVLLTACEVAEVAPLPGDVHHHDTSADSATEVHGDSSADSDVPSEVADEVGVDVDVTEEAVEDTGSEAVESEGEVDEDVVPEVGEETVAEVDEETIEDAAAEVEPEVVADVVEETSAPDVADDTTPACESVVSTFPTTSAHVAACSEITWSTDPPTSGPHYLIWTKWQMAYTVPVPRGHYVHNLEHGGVVFLYNCPDGCDADIAALNAMLAARPADPLCFPPTTNRFVVTADPLIDTRFAVAAWGAHLKAECLDLDAVSAFIDAHYAHTIENTCADGVDVTNPETNPCPPP